MTMGTTIVDAEQAADALTAQVIGVPILEATTLGFVEVYLCVRGLQQIGLSEIVLLYVEPGNTRGLDDRTCYIAGNLIYRTRFQAFGPFREQPW